MKDAHKVIKNFNLFMENCFSRNIEIRLKNAELFATVRPHLTDAEQKSIINAIYEARQWPKKAQAAKNLMIKIRDSLEKKIIS